MNPTGKIINLDDMAVLSAYEEECVMRAIEFALPIRNRGQLYVWAQAYLWSLIAHELLLCACGDFRRPAVNTLHICSRPFSEEQLAEASDPRSGLMARAIDAWHQNGEEPLVIFPGKVAAIQYDRFRTTLERCNLRNFVMHGACGVDGITGTFLILAGLPQQFGARHAYMLNLMMPCIRSAIERILAVEGRQRIVEVPAKVAENTLTRREISILQSVREGKSNKEVGTVLEISPLTVKNHVQRVLKKLKAQNRAQAVSIAISLKLLK